MALFCKGPFLPVTAALHNVLDWWVVLGIYIPHLGPLAPKSQTSFFAGLAFELAKTTKLKRELSKSRPEGARQNRYLISECYVALNTSESSPCLYRFQNGLWEGMACTCSLIGPVRKYHINGNLVCATQQLYGKATSAFLMNGSQTIYIYTRISVVSKNFNLMFLLPGASHAKKWKSSFWDFIFRLLFVKYMSFNHFKGPGNSEEW